MSSYTPVSKEMVFCLFALTESARAIRQLDATVELGAKTEEVQPGVTRRELGSVYDALRLGLQAAANVSRIFWPPRRSSRGQQLRTLVGLPASHGMADRRLRNHIEHMDERLDDWLAAGSRPYLAVEYIIHANIPDCQARDDLIDACAVLYLEDSKEVVLFGERFSIPQLRADLVDIQARLGSALQQLQQAAGWSSTTG